MTLSEGERCRFCGLPKRIVRDDHQQSCPEGPPPTSWDNGSPKDWAETMGYIIYEGSDDR